MKPSSRFEEITKKHMPAALKEPSAPVSDPLLDAVQKQHEMTAGATPAVNDNDPVRRFEEISARYAAAAPKAPPASETHSIDPEPGFWQRVFSGGKGAAKSYASGGVNAAGATAELLGATHDRAMDAQKQEKIAFYQRNLERLNSDLAAATSDAEREKIGKSIRRMQDSMAQWETMDTGFSETSHKAAQVMQTAADDLSESAAEDIAEAKRGAGKVGQFAVDVGVAGAQWAGDYGLGVLTGGGALIPMAIRAFGSGTQQARQEGASLGQQMAYGVGSAALSVGLEKLTNFAKPLSKAFGAGFADEFITKLSGKLGQTAAGRMALSALGEGAEESGETLLDTLLQRITYDKDAEITADTLAEAGYNFLVGGALGGVLGGVGEVAAAKTPAAPDSAALGAEATANGENATTATPAEEKAAEAIVEGESGVKEAKPYVGEMPRNVEDARVKSHSMSAKEYVPAGASIETAYGNKFRKTVETNAEKRLGIGPGKAAYLVASNVTKNGETYYAKVTRESLGKLLYTEKNQRLPVERLVLVDNLERVFDDSVWASSEGDRRARHQIEGFDTLRCSFYIDGKPYYADIKVKVVRDGKRSDSENVVYFLEPEAIQAVKKVEAKPLTLGRPAPKIFFRGNASTGESVAQDGADVKKAPDAESSVGAAEHGFDPFTAAQNEFGTLPSGENPVRPDDVPRSTDGTDRVSQSVVTAKGARVTPDEFVPLIENETMRGRFSYIPITNNATVQAVEETIMDEGWERSLADWTAQVRRGVGGAQVTAMGAMLYNHAVNAGQDQQALDILSDYMMAVRSSAQGLQAARILKRLSPDSRLYMMGRSIQRMVDDLGLDEPITLPQELVDAYRNAEDDAAADEVVREIQQYVADQIPSSLLDKWTALRYTNMLGNFKTQLRNVSGNAGMAVVTEMKNAIAAGLETLAGGRAGRAHAVLPGRELMDAARADFRAHQEEIMSGQRYADNMSEDAFARGVQERRQIFRNPLLEGYRRATNWAMNNDRVGDAAFSRRAYARALAGYLKANNVTAEQFADAAWQAEHGAFLDRARSFSIREAQEATFRDHNALSDWVSRIGRRADTPRAVRAASEGLLPFRRTPTNILVRAAEYSPLGIVRNAVDVARHVRGDDVSGTDIINGIAKTLTGTGIFALGMVLRNAGMLRGGDDEDEEQAAFDDLTGHQPYSLELEDGTSITLDWLTPASMPLFMGVELMDLMQDEGLEVKDLEQALTSIADPMLQMSMLQGMSDMLGDLQYSQSNNLGQTASKAALGYLTQVLTNSLVGQLERTVDGGNDMTYVDKESALQAWAQREIGAASRKIPGWDYNQIPYIDAWGREEETGDVMERAAHNLFNPAYVSKVDVDELESELQRLYDATGAAGVLPDRAGKSFTMDGETRYLTAEEYVQYAKAKGQTSYTLAREAVQSAAYKSMSDDARVDYIAQMFAYASYKARKSVAPEYENDTMRKYADAESAGMSPAQYYVMRQTYDYDGSSKSGQPTQAEAQRYLDTETSLSRGQKADLWSIINASWKHNPYK